MKEELDKKLVEKYPKIFANRHKPMTETAMCWGFDCGDGWYNIIDQLCSNIQHHIDWNNTNFEKGHKQYSQVPQVVADQVKEKFGTLRFYVSGGNDYIHGLITMAESISSVTCEECGSPGHQRSGGWIRTLCDTHEAQYQEGLRQREMKASGLEE